MPVINFTHTHKHRHPYTQSHRFTNAHIYTYEHILLDTYPYILIRLLNKYLSGAYFESGTVLSTSNILIGVGEVII